jgi:hypothetical protein
MHDLIVSNVIFHTLSTLALIVVSAATALHNPLRRREPRQFSTLAMVPRLVTPTRLEPAALPREHGLDRDLELSEAA